MRGSFKFDIIVYNRKQATPLIRRRSATPSPRGEGYIIALFQAFPARGKVLSVSEADEGRSTFLIEISHLKFSIKGRNLFRMDIFHRKFSIKGRSTFLVF